MRLAKTPFPVLAIMMLASPVSAQFIDLSSWTAVTLDLPGGQSAGNWILSDNNTAVTQTINADPSFFLNNQDDSSYTMNGTWQVNTTSDDDLIGFAFGYQDPGHCYIMDWKRLAQNISPYGYRDAGFLIRKMHGHPDDMVLSDYWAHLDDQDRYTILASNLGTGLGWAANKTYDFTLVFTPGAFTVTVLDGETVLWQVTVQDTEYMSGQFAFYNYSQATVRYAGFTQNLAPVCDAGGPYEAELGDPIVFDGTGSIEPDGEIVAYVWDFGDNNTAEGPMPGHIYAATGVYTVELCVTDDGGITSCCQTVAHVSEPVPTQSSSLTEVKNLFR